MIIFVPSRETLIPLSFFLISSIGLALAVSYTHPLRRKPPDSYFPKSSLQSSLRRLRLLGHRSSMTVNTLLMVVIAFNIMLLFILLFMLLFMFNDKVFAVKSCGQTYRKSVSFDRSILWWNISLNARNNQFSHSKVSLLTLILSFFLCGDYLSYDNSNIYFAMWNFFICAMIILCGDYNLFVRWLKILLNIIFPYHIYVLSVCSSIYIVLYVL